MKNTRNRPLWQRMIDLYLTAPAAQVVVLTAVATAIMSGSIAAICGLSFFWSVEVALIAAQVPLLTFMFLFRRARIRRERFAANSASQILKNIAARTTK